MRSKRDMYERICHLEAFVENLDLVVDDHEKRLRKVEKK